MELAAELAGRCRLCLSLDFSAYAEFSMSLFFWINTCDQGGKISFMTLGEMPPAIVEERNKRYHVINPVFNFPFLKPEMKRPELQGSKINSICDPSQSISDQSLYGRINEWMSSQLYFGCMRISFRWSVGCRKGDYPILNSTTEKDSPSENTDSHCCYPTYLPDKHEPPWSF